MSEEINKDRVQTKSESDESSIHFIRNKALYTGFIGGILAGVCGKILYYFNFVEVSQKTFILTSWNDAQWTEGSLGSIISIFLIGLLSIGVALLYYLVFKNIYHLWAGVLYGG